jgi:hypothetical protein
MKGYEGGEAFREGVKGRHRLYAAAPDLLAACEKYLRDWGVGNTSAASDQIQAAVDKARGNAEERPEGQGEDSESA